MPIVGSTKPSARSTGSMRAATARKTSRERLLGPTRGEAAEIPAKIGPFEVIRLIGDGGSARVYLARHPRLETTVALKVLHMATHSPFAAEALDRFEREARIAARLTHPNIVRTYDIEVNDRVPYMVMEFVPGRSLNALLERGRLAPRRALEIARDIGRALTCAHDCGVVHRDVKPANILFDRRGVAKIVDFGVSRLRMSNESLTQTGQLVGTPQYMAPEQIADAPDDVDGRADLFALGVVLYEMLTGHHPFRGKTLFDTLQRIGTLQPPPPSERVPGLPAALDRLVMKLLSKDPAGRPRTAAELTKELEELFEVAASAPVPTSSAVTQKLALPRPSWRKALLGAITLAGLSLATFYHMPITPVLQTAPPKRAMSGAATATVLRTTFRSPIALWHGERQVPRRGGADR